MLIKNIEKQDGKVIIVFDDGSDIEIYEGDYLSMCLYEKSEISKEECEAIIKRTKVKKAKQDAVKFISYKIRSSLEVKRKLEEVGYEPEAIDIVLEDLTKDKYIDDCDYARRYARTKIKLKKISKKQLEFELSQKGISEAIISSIEELKEIDEFEDVKKLILKKFKPIELLETKKKLKALKYIYSKGYGIELVEEAIREITEGVEV